MSFGLLALVTAAFLPTSIHWLKYISFLKFIPRLTSENVKFWKIHRINWKWKLKNWISHLLSLSSAEKKEKKREWNKINLKNLTGYNNIQFKWKESNNLSLYLLIFCLKSYLKTELVF